MRQVMPIETLSLEGTASMTHEETTSSFTAFRFEVTDEGFLWLSLHPVLVRDVKCGLHSALWAALYNFFMEVFGFPPGDNAAQAERMAAVGQDAKAPLLSTGLLVHSLHADATGHIFTLVEGFRMLLGRLEGSSGRGGTMLCCYLQGGRLLLID